METCVSCSEERLIPIEIPSKRFDNLTKEIQVALYNLKENPTIITKGNGKGSADIVRGKEDYLREAYGQLNAEEVFEQVSKDSGVHVNTIMNALE